MTTKQAAVAKMMLENKGQKPLGDILRSAGYSEAIARNPQVVKRSKAFREFMEEAGISDERLAQVLNEGLAAVTWIKTEEVKGVGKERHKTEKIEAKPDMSTRHKYLESAIRLKGHERNTMPQTIIVPIYGGLSARPDDVKLPDDIPLSGYDRDPKDIPA